MDYRELIHLGLTEKESKVYLAALELGKSSVQNISKKADVNRATTYVIIESLMKKGLMSSVDENKKQFFMAEDPEKLKILFQDQELEIARKLDYLDKILPELNAMKAAKNDKPVVRYFEGKEGLRAMAEEFFLTKHDDTAKMIYSLDLLGNIFTTEELNMMKSRRIGKGIRVKSIVNDEKGVLKTDAENYTIPAEKHKITSDIAFFGDKIRIATQSGDLIGIIIENKEISETLKILYDLAWEYLKLIREKEKRHG